MSKKKKVETTAVETTAEETLAEETLAEETLAEETLAEETLVVEDTVVEDTVVVEETTAEEATLVGATVKTEGFGMSSEEYIKQGLANILDEVRENDNLPFQGLFIMYLEDMLSKVR